MIVVLSPGFAADEEDSTCLPAQQQLLLCMKRQFPETRICVIAFEYPYTCSSYLWRGIQVYPLNGRNRNRPLRVRTWWRAWRILSKLNGKENITGLFSLWLDECSFIGHLFSRRYHIKHHTWISGQDARPGNRYVRWIKPRPDALVAMSEFLADEFERNYDIRPAYTIPNALDPLLFANCPAERKIDLLAAGSLIPLKQYALFIDLVARLHTEFPRLRAVLCGDGGQYPLLAARIKALGLEDNIALYGKVAHQELYGMMQASRIFIHPSAYEGCSGACLEALYAGMHVISFTAPANKLPAQWHRVGDLPSMHSVAATLLSAPSIPSERILLYNMEDSASAISDLFPD